MIAALIQSRLDSRRLPQKAVLQLGDKKVIEHCIDAVNRSKYFTPILVTSDRHIDDPLEEVARKNNILFYRGDLENIALRAKNAIKKFHIKYFARVNGDSPFLIPSLLDKGAEIILSANVDLVSNIISRTFPYGISVEVINSKVFIDSYEKLILNTIYTEHYTKFFYDNLNSFKYAEIKNNTDMSGLRTVIDTEEDLEIARAIIKKHPDLLYKESGEILTILNNQ